MNDYRYAEPGTIPEPGEAWRAVGAKTTVLGLCLLDAVPVRPYVDPQFDLLTPWPGKTLGGVFLTAYGPGSTLEYHEFGVVAGWVRHGGRSGFYLSHLYVDSEPSVEGGRRMGYPKELARFHWEDGPTGGSATLYQEERPLCTLRYSRPVGRLRLRLQGTTLSRRDDTIFRFRHRATANWGLCRLQLDIPPESPLAPLHLVQPVMALAGNRLEGTLGIPT